MCIVEIQEKRPNRNALRICSISPLDCLLLGMNLGCVRHLNDFNFYNSIGSFGTKYFSFLVSYISIKVSPYTVPIGM